MNCTDAQTMIHAYIDRELDLVRNVEIEHHLESCAACSRMFAQYQALQQAIQNGPLYNDMPGDLQKRIRTVVRRVAKEDRPYTLRHWRLFAIAGSLAALALVVWMILPPANPSESHDVLVDQILQSHVRSLMLNHLTDVPSSDQHTVKPWFNGKVDFSPTVKDLASQGYDLVGGRLDYVTSRPVATLVYKRRLHIINLFTWPTSLDSDGRASTISRQGYHLSFWQSNGMTYCAVSDLNSAELEQFIRLFQE